MQNRSTHPLGFALGICASILHTNLGSWSITVTHISMFSTWWDYVIRYIHVHVHVCFQVLVFVMMRREHCCTWSVAVPQRKISGKWSTCSFNSQSHAVHVYCMSYVATWKYPLLAYAHACTRGKAIYFICRCYQHKYIVVSQANAHSWGISAHVPHFKGPL